MKKQQLSRWDSLLQCVAAGALRLAPGLGLTATLSALEAQERAAVRKPTLGTRSDPYTSGFPFTKLRTRVVHSTTPFSP
jgi:hypothetical protein